MKLKLIWTSAIGRLPSIFLNRRALNSKLHAYQLLTFFGSPKAVVTSIFSKFEKNKILIVGLFKQRKNKRFSYTPKHRQDEGVQMNEQLKFNRRTTKHLSKHRSKSSSTLLLWLFILGMIFVIWFVLDNYKI